MYNSTSFDSRELNSLLYIQLCSYMTKNIHVYQIIIHNNYMCSCTCRAASVYTYVKFSDKQLLCVYIVRMYMQTSHTTECEICTQNCSRAYRDLINRVQLQPKVVMQMYIMCRMCNTITIIVYITSNPIPVQNFYCLIITPTFHEIPS